MNERAEFLRWLAETYHFWTYVHFDPDLPPTSKDRRRLRQAKSTMIESFSSYANLLRKLGQAAGTSWRLIIDQNNINYGQWTLTTQQFSVERTNSSAGYFFNNMTFLLLEAAARVEV